LRYSIVITTSGNHLHDYLIPCIDSLKAHTDLSDSEVIIVASGCESETKGYINSLGKGFRSIWFDQKIGYTSAANAGIRASTGQYIVLLNDDIVLLSQRKNQWLDMLRKPFDNDKLTGLTGPVKFTWQCGEMQREAIAFWCVMIAKKLFCELGFLDEVFNPGMGEDGDFCIRASLVGYKITQVPNNNSKEFGTGVSDQSFPIFHKGNGTFAEMENIKNDTIERNNKILVEKYSNRLEKIYDTCLKHECDINKLFPTLRKHAIRCNHITEFGVRGVFSTYAFLSAKPDVMRSYDIYTCPNINEAIDVASENNIDFKFTEKNVLETRIENTDLLFIDTLHTYNQLSQE